MSICTGQSLFGNRSQYIKFQNSDLVAIEGVNTVERLLAGDVRMPYKQILKSRIVLKKGQVNYLLNHLGMGDNVTFLAIKATYNSSSVNEEDNYLLWNYSDDFSKLYPMAQFMLLTGNSTNRIKQIYLTNPNDKYDVILDIMVASIDDTYSFFNDPFGQTGTSFVGLSWQDIQSFIVGTSIVLNDKNGNPLIYIELVNINSITRTGTFITIDDDALGTIIWVFTSESEAAQAQSLLSYVLSNINVDISSDPLANTADMIPPVILWNSQVGGTGSFIFDNFGSISSTGFESINDGFTFSTEISLTDFGSPITKSNLIGLLINSVIDNRDGVISITSSSLNINPGNLNQISATGSYTLTLNISDLALNDLSGVNMSLTIIS
jgi:hypothetical protein